MIQEPHLSLATGRWEEGQVKIREKEEIWGIPWRTREAIRGRPDPISCKNLPRSSVLLLISAPPQENSGQDVLDCEVDNSPVPPSPPCG